MFDKATGAFRHKTETSVQLRLTGQEPVEAFVFHVNGERLTDLLNDPRAFIPMRSANGEIMIVAKTHIASMIETNIEDTTAANDQNDEPVKRAPKSFDPYATLRISPDADNDALRAAFKARIKSVHPDTVASLGLDEDLANAASQATQKIIYAYRKIMRERKVSGDGGVDDVAEAASQAL